MEANTPMLKQYQQIKSRHKDAILFFRLGDFYEMFYDDAKDASGLLDLVLTSRGKSPNGRIPMCGIPYHSSENYIARLIKAGRKVAICEQVEDPAQAKGLVKRDVIRTITAGTYLDDSTDARYILSILPGTASTGLAFIDTATGTIHTNQYTSSSQMVEIIAKLPVCECVYPESQQAAVKALLNHPILTSKKITLTPVNDWSFNFDIARKGLCEHFATHSLKGFGIDELKEAQSACGALLEYLKDMNKQPLKHIDRVSLYADGQYVFISPAAYYGLEMETLLKTLDHTMTPMGRRLFRFWLYHPLKNPETIRERQTSVTALLNNTRIQDELGASLLRNIPDIEKALSRLSCGCAAPKDILAIRSALIRIPDLKEALKPLSDEHPEFFIEDMGTLRTLLERAINPDTPLSKYEGKVIQKGFHEELDKLRAIQENGREWLKEFQRREIERSGINSLKVGYNRVFGYYLEITKANAHLVPADYIRKQTLVNGERYITPELKEYEENILTANDKIAAIENKLLAEIQKAILSDSGALHTFSERLAVIDVLYSLSLLAQQPGYIVPVVDDSTILDIKEGRHPVVEQKIAEDFIPNDTLLDCEDNHLVILTGPNMAGKSTYIRQTAMLVIMAQIGSYIPASKARIGYVDKIFTRIGAHDEISKGQSTFMVEMTETADILNNMTDRSLIILDEIGRGTSTYDGLSLAWALAEHLQARKSRTMFATHFHELTALADQYPGVKNYNVAVKEWEDKIIFLHKIVPGGTDDSYGIYVAKLAGIPNTVIQRSKKILSELESQSKGIASRKPPSTQYNLFTEAPPETNDPILEEIRDELELICINTMTPIEAMNRLNKLKEKLNKSAG